MGSFAAHKHGVGDFTHASMKPDDMLAGGRKGRRSKKKGKGADEDELFGELAGFKRTSTNIHKKRGSVFI